MAALPAQAGPVSFSQVVQVMSNVGNGGQNSELRLRTIQQGSTTPTSGGQSAAASTSQNPGTTNGNAAGGNGGGAATTQEPPTLIAGSQTPTQSAAQDPNVQVIEQGDVEATICDCGEILVPGGWPKWPLLAAVPLVCLTGICTTDHKVCVGPECNPPCVDCGEIPEPASLLLFGSGLAALAGGVRRRRRIKLEAEKSNATEV
jgi:hypothetical protein